MRNLKKNLTSQACEFCGALVIDYKSHLSLRHSDKFKCPICGRNQRSEKSLAVHIASVHETAPCDKCGMEVSPANVKMHNLTNHTEETGEYKAIAMLWPDMKHTLPPCFQTNRLYAHTVTHRKASCPRPSFKTIRMCTPALRHTRASSVVRPSRTLPTFINTFGRYTKKSMRLTGDKRLPRNRACSCCEFKSVVKRDKSASKSQHVCAQKLGKIYKTSLKTLLCHSNEFRNCKTFNKQ